MSGTDLNKFDEDRFETDEDYQDQVRSTPVGVALEVLATSMTLQDCGEFIALVQPDLLAKFFTWAEKNYPELDIDPEEAVRLVNEAVKNNEIGIQKP
jgi:hypothetical protein